MLSSEQRMPQWITKVGLKMTRFHVLAHPMLHVLDTKVLSFGPTTIFQVVYELQISFACVE